MGRMKYGHSRVSTDDQKPARSSGIVTGSRGRDPAGHWRDHNRVPQTGIVSQNVTVALPQTDDYLDAYRRWRKIEPFDINAKTA